jgi:hypothetical protein
MRCTKSQKTIIFRIWTTEKAKQVKSMWFKDTNRITSSTPITLNTNISRNCRSRKQISLICLWLLHWRFSVVKDRMTLVGESNLNIERCKTANISWSMKQCRKQPELRRQRYRSTIVCTAIARVEESETSVDNCLYSYCPSWGVRDIGQQLFVQLLQRSEWHLFF